MKQFLEKIMTAMVSMICSHLQMEILQLISIGLII